MACIGYAGLPVVSYKDVFLRAMLEYVVFS